MTKRVIEREQSIMGRIFFIFKVNTVEKVLRDLFQLYRLQSRHLRLIGIIYVYIEKKQGVLYVCLN